MNLPPKRRKVEGAGPPGRNGPTQLGFTGSGPRPGPALQDPNQVPGPRARRLGLLVGGGGDGAAGETDPSPLAIHLLGRPGAGEGKSPEPPHPPLFLSPLLSSREGPLTGTLGRLEGHGVCGVCVLVLS